MKASWKLVKSSQILLLLSLIVIKKLLLLELFDISNLLFPQVPIKVLTCSQLSKKACLVHWIAKQKKWKEWKNGFHGGKSKNETIYSDIKTWIWKWNHSVWFMKHQQNCEKIRQFQKNENLCLQSVSFNFPRTTNFENL